MLYSFVSFSDGAFVLIPVMAFYWFTYMVFLHGWPGTQKFALTGDAPAQTAATLTLEPS